MSNVHLGLELSELFAVSGLCLGAHLLASPLHGTVNLACEVHDVVISVESSNLGELSTEKLKALSCPIPVSQRKGFNPSNGAMGK